MHEQHSFEYREQTVLNKRIISKTHPLSSKVQSYIVYFGMYIKGDMFKVLPHLK